MVENLEAIYDDELYPTLAQVTYFVICHYSDQTTRHQLFYELFYLLSFLF